VVGPSRKLVAVLLGIGLAGSVLAGCSPSSDSGGSPSGPGAGAGASSIAPSGIGTASTGSAPTATAAPDVPPSGTSGPSASPSASPSPAPTAGKPSTPSTGPQTGMLRLGASGQQVLGAQQRLVELGYWLGTADGRYGELTAQAVTAMQKVAGLSRDGVIGPKTSAALRRGPRPSAHSTSGHVIEVDLKRQVLAVVDDGRIGRILNASTGSGAFYTAPDGHPAHATTPTGRFAVEWAADRWDTSPLGHLYRPRYFHPRGIAVHGFGSVPPFAASHGCVRISVPAMDMIWAQSLMPLKSAVWVY
jgi:lipoprotein-anchoring transpeptidase ErfK/SrfK